MKSVTKNQFTALMAEKWEMPKKKAGETIEMMLDEILKIMKTGDKLNLSGFGIFKVADRKARMGRNPKTGEAIHIKASKKAKFTPSKALKEAVL
ncbi:MAG: HU family DNA-binding protein [Parcubacteria group bacterium]